MKELADLFTEARVKYFGMAIAHGGKLPSFYEMRWKDFGLNEKVKKLGFSPDNSIENTICEIKKKMRKEV